MDKTEYKKSISHLNIRHIWALAGIIAIIACVSFYFDDGYVDLGENKYKALLITCLIVLPVWLIMYVYSEFIRGSRSIPEYIAGMTSFGWFVVLFTAAGLMSTLTSSFIKTSFLGQDGWHMGFLVQLLMTGSLLMCMDIAAAGDERLIYAVISSAFIISAVVFVLGIINRFAIYPFYMTGQAEDFISTLGNINWFCGYLCVWFGLGCGVYLMTGSKAVKALMAVYVLIGTTAGICCGASSFYLAAAAIGFGALMWALSDPKRLCRLCDMGMIALLALPAVRFIGFLRPDMMRYNSAWLFGVSYKDTWIFPFMAGMFILGTIYVIVSLLKPDLKSLRPIISGALIGIIIATVLMIILNTVIEGGIWPVRGMGIFTWGVGWGNSRGSIWIATAELLKRMFPLRMFFGVGCDCFCAYAYSMNDMIVKLTLYLGDLYLTNAHNEFLSMLVNEGIVGTVAYFGLQVSHIKSCTGNIQKKQGGIILGSILCAAAYIIIGMVGFMHVLSTPFYFMIMGFAAGLIKREQINYNNGQTKNDKES